MMTAVKERALPCQAEAVCGILDGIKSQTRRLMSTQPINDGEGLKFGWATLYKKTGAIFTWDKDGTGGENWNIKDFPVEDAANAAYRIAERQGFVSCPYGKVGDRLWVRERARLIEADGDAMKVRAVIGIKKGQRVRLRYEADGTESDWLPYPTRLSYLEIGDCVSNGCYKEARRILLEIISIRVERVQDISEADALAEGAKLNHYYKGSEREPVTYRQAYEDWFNSIYGADAWKRNPWVWVIEFKNITDSKGV